MRAFIRGDLTQGENTRVLLMFKRAFFFSAKLDSRELKRTQTEKVRGMGEISPLIIYREMTE